MVPNLLYFKIKDEVELIRCKTAIKGSGFECKDH